MKFMNEAGWDRIARVVLGVVMVIVGLTDVVGGTAGTVIAVIGFVPLITGIVGWCPLYALFRFRTNSEPREVARANS